uniref:Odorant binding protein n=1 Tax=Semiothisa cinerearia TaxID=2249628 RepID=A0A889XL46_9NEOP|nr:odorant binding protein [Semiothisa cinerearia]
MLSSVNTVILLTFLPVLAKCTGEGNIKLLEEEVAAALKTCAESDNSSPKVQRQKRYADNAPRIDDGSQTEASQYSHERRNFTDMKDQIYVINSTDTDYDGYGSGNMGEKFVNSMPKAAAGRNYPEVDVNGINRTRRSEPLFSKPDTDQCLSQCVFANLQVVDSRGIPREAELWNKVQSSVSSQQSRAALKDQISACFQELQSEAEDNGCSYSNKLERCLMLRFTDRKQSGAKTNDNSGAKST